MIVVTDLDSIKNYREFELKWERKMFYGYDGPEDGFYKWLDTKQQEFESSNKQGCIPLKDSNKMAKRARNSALLSEQKGSDIVQNKTMRVSGKGIAFYASQFRVITAEDADKAWYSLRSTDKS